MFFDCIECLKFPWVSGCRMVMIFLYNVICYLVKWEGFRVEHNSWEPWDNIHAPECVADFHQRHPGAACHIRACDFNAIPLCSSLSSAVSGGHSLEGWGRCQGTPNPTLAPFCKYVALGSLSICNHFCKYVMLGSPSIHDHFCKNIAL